MRNQVPALIGTLTLFGVVVHNEQIFIWTMIIIALTSIVSAMHIIRQEFLRCRRIKLIDVRRSARHANSTDSRQ